MDLELKDKVAVITGAGIGIGLAIAKGLAREGGHLVLAGRNQERLSQAAGDLRRKFGVSIIAVKADVTKASDIEGIKHTTEKEFGGADILINNAGCGSEEKIMEAPDEKWQYYLDLHLMAAVRLSKALVPAMRKRGGGVIINNASVCAKQPLGYEPIYNVSKAALIMFSKCLANELISDNIRVNAVNPGYTLTPDWLATAASLGKQAGISAEDYIDRIAKDNTPIGRFASTEEIANLFVFLCSPRAGYCVGSTYYIDGGCLKSIV